MTAMTPIVSEPLPLDRYAGLSQENLILAGQYSHVERYVTVGNFLSKSVAATEAVLVHFDHETDGDLAVKELAAMRLRPATLPDLLAYAAAHWQGVPQLVSALGSVWMDPYGLRLAPFLGSWRGGRGLLLDAYNSRRTRGFHLLAARM